MFSARLPISICAAALLAASAAQAADYPQPQPVYVPRPVVIEEYSSWYLRGDIGFSNQQVGSLWTDTYNSVSGLQTLDRGFDAAPLFGLGVGYNFNDWLRFDVTGEYRGRANFHGLDSYRDNTFCVGCYSTDSYNGSKSELAFLLNGYVDLGTWSNVTPFVGAGVGVSRNTISSFSDTGLQHAAFAWADSTSKWSLAWALHAGLAYKVSKNLTVELAYRYIDLGSATTGGLIDWAGNSWPAFEFRHLTSHDLKLGLRFNLDGFADYARPVQYYQQPQVYTPPPPVYAPPVYQPPLRSRG
jgi:opacity protein-like surface antigen